jgi:hypothetical protein
MGPVRYQHFVAMKEVLWIRGLWRANSPVDPDRRGHCMGTAVRNFQGKFVKILTSRVLVIIF